MIMQRDLPIYLLAYVVELVLGQLVLLLELLEMLGLEHLDNKIKFL